MLVVWFVPVLVMPRDRTCIGLIGRRSGEFPASGVNCDIFEERFLLFVIVTPSIKSPRQVPEAEFGGQYVSVIRLTRRESRL